MIYKISPGNSAWGETKKQNQQTTMNQPDENTAADPTPETTGTAENPNGATPEPQGTDATDD